MRQISVSAVFLAAILGCGGGSDGGTEPNGQVLGSIVASTTAINLVAGGTQEITMQALDANGQAIANATGYQFAVQDPAVATLVSAGRIIGLGAGSTTVNVSLTRGGITKTATVSVIVTGTLPSQATVTAGATTNTFSPSILAVARAAIVKFVFGGLEHNVTFGGSGPANIGNSTNVEVNRQFNNAGTFAYTCTLHPGMAGTIIVP